MDFPGILKLPLVVPLGGDVIEIAGLSGVYAATLDSIARVGGIPVGNSVAFPKTSSGTNTLLAAAAAPRQVIILVTTTEAIADAGGTAPVFTVGEEDGSATKFAAAADLGAALNDIRVFSGVLTANKKLEVYATAALSTGTGAINAIVIAVKPSN